MRGRKKGRIAVWCCLDLGGSVGIVVLCTHRCRNTGGAMQHVHAYTHTLPAFISEARGAIGGPGTGGLGPQKPPAIKRPGLTGEMADLKVWARESTEFQEVIVIRD